MVSSILLPSDKSNSSPALQVIEISSDSEDDAFRRPSFSQCEPTLQKEDKHESTWANDIIELTDSESDNNSDIPHMLFPLVRGRRKKQLGSPRKQSLPAERFIPLYADTSDDEGPDKDCILVLNDPSGSQKPIRNIPPVQGHDVAKGKSPPSSPKRNAVPESLALQKSPVKKSGKPAQKAKEQARRQKYAIELFAELNRDIFGDHLPKDTVLEWSKRLLTTAGRARWHRSRENVHTTKIELASKILDCDERIRNTLSHEMCHLACWVIDNQPREGHGPLFRSWANKVMHKRPDIHVSTRHNYEISYPYEWKCEKCSKTYGRYSKSIRPEECVCGACKLGKLIPQFGERKKTTVPKVSRMAVTKPRDSPCSTIGVLVPTRNAAVMHHDSRPTNQSDILGLVNALEGIIINDESGYQEDNRLFYH